MVAYLVVDKQKLKKGNINASKFIDNISKGLTGTSISLIGYFYQKMSVNFGKYFCENIIDNLWYFW